MRARPTIVGIGEILWDMFPDGPQFGGAPANFACSAAKLGGDDVEAHVVSAVGSDELGRRALELLRGRGVGTDFVSVVDRPTGQVLVHLDSAGQASYEFAANTAWDNLAWSEDLAKLAAEADAVCFGTLGQRSGISRETIQRFLSATRRDCLRIFDVNLRSPFWTAMTLRGGLESANVLKLNDAELPVLAEVIGWKSSDDELVAQLHSEFSLKIVALTRGADGARLSTATGEVSDLPGDSAVVVNTVGAGDAYTAAMAIGLLRNMPIASINAWANRVATYVCTQPGAAPDLPASLRAPSDF